MNAGPADSIISPNFVVGVYQGFQEECHVNYLGSHSWPNSNNFFIISKLAEKLHLRERLATCAETNRKRW